MNKFCKLPLHEVNSTPATKKRGNSNRTPGHEPEPSRDYDLADSPPKPKPLDPKSNQGFARPLAPSQKKVKSSQGMDVGQSQTGKTNVVKHSFMQVVKSNSNPFTVSTQNKENDEPDYCIKKKINMFSQSQSQQVVADSKTSKKLLMFSQSQNQMSSGSFNDMCTPADQVVQPKTNADMSYDLQLSKHISNNHRSKAIEPLVHSDVNAMTSELNLCSSEKNYFWNETITEEVNKQVAQNTRLYNEFITLGKLGSGSFGEVLKVKSRLDGCVYAIKKPIKESLSGTAKRKAQLKELFAISYLNNVGGAPASILKYYSSWFEGNDLIMQLEYCPNGSLKSQLNLNNKSKIPIDPEKVFNLFLQMAEAVSFLHSNNVVHMDIKPDNFLEFSPQSFRLADFGLTVPLYGSNSPQENGHIDLEGDKRYLSREIMQGSVNELDLKSGDVFALGLSIYELYGGDIPAKGPSYDQIRYGVLPPIELLPENSVLYNLLKSMIDPTPSFRPTANDAFMCLKSMLMQKAHQNDLVDIGINKSDPDCLQRKLSEALAENEKLKSELCMFMAEFNK